MLWRQVLSHSPVAENEFELARNPDSEFRKSLARINSLIHRGGSLSGHERNCVFLNAQGKSFATISAVSGFDFDDDARGLATVDWDADGDLDLWVSNRTSTRVRFLRNELPNRGDSLGLLLKGTSCNRDAVGARVVVHLVGDPKPITKTVRAGEGFLSQSSKWLLFGCGGQLASDGRTTRDVPPTIQQVEIIWPNGRRQNTGQLEVGKRYVIVEGSQPQLVPARSVPLKIEPTEPSPFKETGQARIALTSPIPCPALPFAKFGEQKESNAIDASQPTLVNLWASWCQPCLQELHEFASRSNELQNVNLRMVAISVDRELDETVGPSSSSTDAETTAKRLKLPFVVGHSTPELVRRLQLIYDLPFSWQVAMPVPTSFLLDSRHRVVAIYRGPISVDAVLNDVALLKKGNEVWRDAALPLPGRWNERPVAMNRLTVARDLLTRNQIDDAFEYVEQFSDELSDDKELTKLRGWLGDELIKANRVRDGLQQYQVALQDSPGDLTLINNFAWQLATQSDASVRNGELAVRWAERAANATAFRNPGVLDTLAASYAEQGQFEKAVKIVTLAIGLTNSQQQAFAVRLRQRLELYKNGQPFRE